MKFVPSVLGLASMTNAHTMFSTLYIDGKSQGDGTCVRMPLDGETATNPVHSLIGADMACGRDGGAPVAFICPASKGAILTFEFRTWPDGRNPGSIDPGHLGPCAVYVKKVDDMFADSAAGPGWFKIWEDGFNRDTQKWCVDTLVENNGLLSVNLPAGLPSGYYLVRPEVIALHFARKGDPQYYTGCAQIFLESDVNGPLEIPQEYNVSIPGYVNSSTPGLTYNIYQRDLPPYPIPGPKVYVPSLNNNTSDRTPAPREVQAAGSIPKHCILKNANWCAYAIQSYESEGGCWRATRTCTDQSRACWKSAPASGPEYCYVWSDYCALINNMCKAGHWKGPPLFNSTKMPIPVPILSPLPSPLRRSEETVVGEDGRSSKSSGVPSTVVKMAVTPLANTENTAPGEGTYVEGTITAEKTVTATATKTLVTRRPPRIQQW